MHSPFHQDEAAREISDINVVPLADVSLVLLIILLLLSPMMAQSMLHVKTAGEPEKAPEFVVPQPPPLDQELVLVVDLGPRGIAVGKYFFAGPGEFIAFMTGELSRRADRKVFLAPHPDVMHGQVVHMIEMIKSCGAESVALVQTQEENPPPEPAVAAPGPGAP